MRLRTPDAPDGEGVNKWQRTGISDGLLTPIAPAAEAAPVSSPEGRARRDLRAAGPPILEAAAKSADHTE